jgi:hypothetical protein
MTVVSEWFWIDGTKFSGNHWSLEQPGGPTERDANGKARHVAVGADPSGDDNGVVLFDEANNSAVLPLIWEGCGGGARNKTNCPRPSYNC